MDDRIIRTKLEALKGMLARPVAEIGPWQAREGKYLDPGSYEYHTEWAPVTLPASWPALKTVFLKAPCSPQPIPDGHQAFLQWDHDNFEAMLSVNQKPFAGIDANHKIVRVPEEPCELLLEAFAVPSAQHRPANLALKASVQGVRIVAVHPLERQAVLDIEYAQQTTKAIAPGRRRSLLEAAIEEALLIVDLTRPREEIQKQVIEAGQVFRKRLAEIGRDPEGGKLFYAGHTHIDTAWLWPVRESVRKCGRTFSTAVRLMESYPDFYFSCSQAQLFAYTQAHYPSLYEEIKHWVKKGQFLTTGAMWVETDCNVTSGESLVRQILYGVQFFQKEFGTRPRSCWLPDVFGYPGSLPQILSRCGVPYFFTYKLHWQARNPFPDHLFHWEGIDGTRVLGHIPLLRGGYNGYPMPDQLVYAWEQYLQKGKYPEVLFPYGFGDGGGGPTWEMIEQYERAKDYPGLPAGRTGSEEQFFQDAEKSGLVTDVWAGELYLETHRGTYTTHGDAKTGNRRCELALRDAEILGTLADWSNAPVDLSGLRKGWELTLLNQFHDILPGSSIGGVYDDMRRDHQEVLEIAKKASESACSSLTQPEESSFTLFNTCAWTRQDPVILKVPSAAKDVSVVDAKGTPCPAQVLSQAQGQTEILVEPGEVHGFGAKGFRIASQPAKTENTFSVTENRMESPLYVIEFSKDGSICRLLDKKANREIVPSGEKLNEFHFYQDGPEGEAAWNVHLTYEKKRYEQDPKADFQVIHSGPLSARVRVTRRFRSSTFVQDVILYRSSPRIDFVTEADWQERQVMLKAMFPVTVRSTRSTAEIQFGAIERSTNRNTSWEQEKFEVCGQRWVDLSEPGYGVSLLNDCKYGYDFRSSRIGITLLRGPESPDPKADLGHHTFTYALLPHVGDWTQAETVRRAYELNVGWTVANGRLPKSQDPWISATGLCVVIDTLKPAENGQGWILRAYEPHGSRGTVTLTVSKALKSVTETNLVEEDEGKVSVSKDQFTADFQPFQIRTFRLM